MGVGVGVCLGKGKNERSSLQLDRTKTRHLVSSPSLLLYPEGKVGKWEKFISKYSNTHSDILSSRGVGMSAFSHRRDGSQGSSGWSIPVEEGSGEVSQALDHVWSLGAVGGVCAPWRVAAPALPPQSDTRLGLVFVEPLPLLF